MPTRQKLSDKCWQCWDSLIPGFPDSNFLFIDVFSTTEKQFLLIYPYYMIVSKYFNTLNYTLYSFHSCIQTLDKDLMENNDNKMILKIL